MSSSKKSSKDISQKDSLQRFLFQHADIRGELVQLTQTWQTILSHKDYPPLIRQYLGELMTASVLLAATLKLDGSLTIQATGNGVLNLLVAECRDDLSVRCVAKHHPEIPENAGLKELLGEGSLAITIDQKKGKNYQGIVNLEGNSVSQLLENYLQSSEQLNTKIWLAASEQGTAGLLLQELPTQSGDYEEDWERVNALASTITEEELLNLEANEVLYRLFHEEQVQVFEPNQVSFKCNCSQAKVVSMLRSLSQAEAYQLMKEEGFIEVNCEFCGKNYRFDEMALAELYKPQPTDNRSIH